MHDIPVEDIAIPPRLRRRLDEDKVAAIAESIGAIGLQNPIHIRWVMDEEEGEIPSLVAGRHRLEALRRRGDTWTRVFVLEGTDTEIRLWEISENLHRAELTAQERLEHIAEWIKLTEQRLEEAEEVSRHGVAKPRKGVGQGVGGGRPEGGTAAAARELNINEREAQRAVKFAKMEPEVKKAIQNAGLDNHPRVLLAIASKPKEKQLAAVEAEKQKREKKPAKPAEERTSNRVKTLMKTWDHCTPIEQDEFLRYIGKA